MLNPIYRLPEITIPFEERAKVNAGILRLIRAGAKPDRLNVLAAYTGRGGLHGLEYSDFRDRRSYSLAKHEIEEGQVFTPDPVVELAAKVLNPEPGASVCDPTCGAGAFLNWFNNGFRLYGNDIDIDAVSVARYVFPEAEISACDIRSYAPPVSFDAIVGNPPFGLRWVTSERLTRNSEITTRSEDVFLKFIARHLRRGGVAAFVVPSAWPRDEMVYAETRALLHSTFIVEGEFLLDEEIFARFGCRRVSTKLMLIRSRLDDTEEQEAVPLIDTRGLSTEEVLEKWAIEGRRFFAFQERARSLRARLTFEQARNIAAREDKGQAYTFGKYAYQLSVLSKEAADLAWQRWAKAHERCPDGMKLEGWEKIRIRPETVLAETRKAVRRQNIKPRPLVRLSRTKNGLGLISYSAPAASALSGQSKAWSWLDLEAADPDLSVLKENLERLNGRDDREKISFETLNWRRVVGRNRRKLALWRKPVESVPDENDLTAVEAGYAALGSSYGLRVRREQSQITKLAQVVSKEGALLAWQQGTGKTFAAMVYALIKAQRDRAAKRRVGANLVVTSSLAVTMNWLPELRKAGRTIIDSLETLASAGAEDWVVLTHAQAHKFRRKLREMAKCRQITTLVLDEADEYANPASIRYRAVRAFANKVRYRLLTTGTPARNTAAELFTQLAVTFAGSPAFQCVAPIIVEEQKDGSLMELLNDQYLKSYPSYGGHGLFRRCHSPVKTTVLGQKRAVPDIPNGEELSEFLGTIRSRLTIEELMGYDPLNVRVVEIEMTPGEKGLYNKILQDTCYFVRRELEAFVESRKLNQLAIAQAIKILQQACSIPSRYPEFSGGRQAKLEYLVETCRAGLHAHTAVGTIWKQATHEIGRFLQSGLDFPVIVFTGEEAMAQRKTLLAQFAGAERAVLVTTQQSLRSSVNVRCVSRIIAESLPWNFSALGQWARRFVRYDSDARQIELEILVARGTIEERLLGLNIRKEGIALCAAGDIVEDDLDPILDQYGAQSSTLNLLTEYLAGERDSSLNVKNLKKQLKEAA